MTKRDLIRYFARIAPGDAAAPRGAAAQPPALPERRRRARLLAEGHPVDARRSGSTIWHETGFREREDRAANDHLIADRAATLCWLGNQAVVRDPRLDLDASTTRWTPTFALIDIDPGTKTTWDETLVARAALPDRARAPRRARLPEDDRQARHPGLDPDRARPLLVPRHQRLGREAVAGGRRDRARTSCRGSGRRPTAAARRASTTPRTRASRRSSRRTRSGRGRRRARSRRRSAGRSSTTRRSRPDRWTIRTLVERVAEVGDLFAAAQTDHQELPAL